MANIFHLAYAAVLAVLFIYVLWIPKAPTLPRVLLLVLIGPLVYDNFICGIGSTIGEGPLLRALNIPRFILHVFATPLICIIPYEFARNFGVPVAVRPAAQRIVLGLCAALVVIGFVQELSPLILVPKSYLGVLRYAHPVPSPPIAALVATFFALAAAFLIWRKTGWPVLLITSLLMLFTAGIPPKLFGLLPGNAGEIIFMAGFMLGLKRLAANRSL